MTTRGRVETRIEAVSDALRTVISALEAGDLAALEAGLAARERAQSALPSTIAEPLPTATRLALEALRALDARARTLAHEAHEGSREELEQLRSLRHRLARLPRARTCARFLSERA